MIGRLSGSKRGPRINPRTAARLSFQPPGLPCTQNALTDARHPAWLHRGADGGSFTQAAAGPGGPSEASERARTATPHLREAAVGGARGAAASRTTACGEGFGERPYGNDHTDEALSPLTERLHSRSTT